jgi:FkbM family methyltransferase
MIAPYDETAIRTEAPFGAFRPTLMQNWMRGLARALPYNYAGRKLASLLLGPAGGRRTCAFDVEIFGSQKARLHPGDNICEKRVYLTPHHWDPVERALLARAIGSHTDDSFVFADIGANAGLYTLFARAETLRAGRKFRALCVEPDPEMRARLAFNVAASGAKEEIEIFPYAATAADGPVGFAVNRKSRGMSHVDASGALTVEGRSLVSILNEADVSRLDAMKIDIEGHEYDALEAFFENAPPGLLPQLVFLETSHEAPERAASALVLSAGYRVALANSLNTVFVRG